MSDKEDSLSLEDAVRQLHRDKYRKSTVWTDIFSEFKTFAKANGQQAYFRLHTTPTEYRYSEDAHSRVGMALSGLIANLEVERIEQGFDQALFLLRSDCNYVSLREFLKIKSGLTEHVEPRFLVNVLNFFNRLIPVLVAEQIHTELTLSSICFQAEVVRLCDYDLLFYPRNMRSEAKDLREQYLRQAALALFELLSLKSPSSNDSIYRAQVSALLK